MAQTAQIFHTSHMVERIEQQRNDDCANACVAMLTDMSLEETHEAYGSPCWEDTPTSHILREYYSEVHLIPVLDAVDLHWLTDRGFFDAVHMTVQSPVSEYDEEAFWEHAASDGHTDIRHAVVYVDGELQDPSPHEYWTSLDDLLDSPYEVCDCYLLVE